MRITSLLTLIILLAACSNNVGVSSVEPGSILGKWEYIASATEARNMGIPVITPWPINALTFNEDGTLLVDTRKDGVLNGTWFLDQNNDRYILKSEALFLSQSFVKASDVLSKKMVLSYEETVDLYETAEDKANENTKEQLINPTFLYKRSKER